MILIGRSPNRHEERLSAGDCRWRDHAHPGWASDLHAGSAPIALHAGDNLFFPPYTSGVWDIQETLRKIYVLISCFFASDSRRAHMTFSIVGRCKRTGHLGIATSSPAVEKDIQPVTRSRVPGG